MNICQKCHGVVIRGPIYERDVYGERLRYTCFTCGYSTATPTKDAQIGSGTPVAQEHADPPRRSAAPK